MCHSANANNINLKWNSELSNDNKIFSLIDEINNKYKHHEINNRKNLFLKYLKSCFLKTINKKIKQTNKLINSSAKGPIINANGNNKNKNSLA